MDARCIPLAFNFWFQILFFLILFLCLCIRLKKTNSVKLCAFGDPLYFLFYQQTTSIAQLSALNKPQVQLDPVLLFWNYLSIVSSPLQALFYKRNLQVHIFCSLYMPFWSMVQQAPILSGPEISPWTPQKVRTQRRGEHACTLPQQHQGHSCVWCLI